MCDSLEANCFTMLLSLSVISPVCCLAPGKVTVSGLSTGTGNELDSHADHFLGFDTDYTWPHGLFVYVKND